VPAGTRNHLALDLGLDRADVVGALDAFTDGIERRIDLATVNGRTFVNNVSLGLYAEIVQSPDYRAAKLRTTATMLPDLLGSAVTPLDLRYVEPGGEQRHTAHLILVSNNPYQLAPGGGLGTRERIDRGLLGIVTVMIGGAGDAQKFLTLQAAGQGRRFHGWVEWSAPRFEVGSGAKVQIGVDGEALAVEPPVVFESRPGALRVRLPRHALRVSPASRATRVLSGSTLAQLGRVATGKPGSG
jgi:diacylglycerol kinase family enzyme